MKLNHFKNYIFLSILLVFLIILPKTVLAVDPIQVTTAVINTNLPSPGETVTGTIEFFNPNSTTETITGSVSMTFFAVGGNLSGDDSSYFTFAGNHPVDQPIAPFGTYTETFTTTVQTGSICLTGNVQIRGDPIPVGGLSNVDFPPVGGAGQTNGGIGATLIVDVIDDVTGVVVPDADVEISGTYNATQKSNASGFATFSRLNCNLTHIVTARFGSKTGSQNNINTFGTPGTNYICNGRTQRIQVRIKEPRTCNLNRTYNQCCGPHLSQRVDEYTWSDGSGICQPSVVGACNQVETGSTCFEPPILDPFSISTSCPSDPNVGPTGTLSWTCSGTGGGLCTPLPDTDSVCPNGFWVDISTDPAFFTAYRKCVTGTSTDAPSGFSGLKFQPGQTYHARVYNGLHSNIESQSVPANLYDHDSCFPRTQGVPL